MIVLNCECGETYRADEKHIGYSIRCSKCQRIIRVAKLDHSTLSSREEPAIEYIPPEPIYSPSAPKRPFTSKRSFLNNRVVPALGILALIVGVTLTIINFRARKVETQTSNVISQPSVIPATATPINALNTNVPNNSQMPSPSVRPSPTSSISKPQTVTPAIDFSDVAQPTTSTINSQNSQESTQYEVSNPSPTPIPYTVRYPNGTNLMRPQNSSGRGILRISNGTSSDAIAKLVDSVTNKTDRRVYIRASSNVTISNIGTGDYILKFCLGTGYDPNGGRFLYSQSFERFDDILDFREYETYDGIRWKEFEVTLNPVIGGNARTSPISAADFEDH